MYERYTLLTLPVVVGDVVIWAERYFIRNPITGRHQLRGTRDIMGKVEDFSDDMRLISFEVVACITIAQAKVLPYGEIITRSAALLLDYGAQRELWDDETVRAAYVQARNSTNTKPKEKEPTP